MYGKTMIRPLFNRLKPIRTQQLSVTMSYTASNDTMLLRQATRADKQKILAVRPDFKEDYVPEYLDFLIEDQNRECYLIEMEKTVVAFGTLLYTDAGQTAFATSARVHKEFESRGLFSFPQYNACQRGKQKGCASSTFIVNEQLSKKISPEKHVNKKHIYKASVDLATRTTLHADPPKLQNVVEIDLTVMERYIQSELVKQYLFPGNTIRVDRISYKVMVENVQMLPCRSSKFYSSFKEIDGVCSGLVSAGTYYKCALAPGYYMYIADLFESDTADVENHLMFHLNEATNNVPGPYFLELSVDIGTVSDKVAVVLDRKSLSNSLDEDVTIKTPL